MPYFDAAAPAATQVLSSAVVKAAVVAQRASGLQALAGHAMPAGTAALRPTGSNSALDTRKALAVPLCRDT